MNPTFSLAIPHAPWVEGRTASLERLMMSLDIANNWDICKYDLLFADKEPNHVWSRRMWTWGAARETTHFLTLQDDAIVCEEFWYNIFLVVKAFPDSVIGLHAAHPASKAALVDGASYYTTRDYLVGVGYCLPTELLAEFLDWRDNSLRDGWETEITEDTLLAMWCACTGRKIVHPIPALVTHDTGLKSAYGNDRHDNRISPTFSLTKEWRYKGGGPHLGAFYSSLLSLA